MGDNVVALGAKKTKRVYENYIAAATPMIDIVAIVVSENGARKVVHFEQDDGKTTGPRLVEQANDYAVALKPGQSLDVWQLHIGLNDLIMLGSLTRGVPGVIRP